MSLIAKLATPTMESSKDLIVIAPVEESGEDYMGSATTTQHAHLEFMTGLHQAEM